MQKVSPQKTPQVVGKLLDLDANEDFVRGLLQSIGILCPVEELVEQVSSRRQQQAGRTDGRRGGAYYVAEN